MKYNVLDGLLLKDIELATKKKLIKKGIFMLYKEGLYYVTLYIKNIKGDIKKIEVPKPFDITVITKNERIEFDYTLAQITKGCKKKLESINKLPRYKESKYYNTTITLVAV
jgi:hypothetical protein